jgi:uncharacterized protein DUF4380
MRCLRIGVLLLSVSYSSVSSSTHAAVNTHAPCRVQSTTYHGWTTQEISNQWTRLVIAPQLGGRLMQIEFGEHPYLFVNPKFMGKYIPPETAKGEWVNYGGDKLWPLPEGRGDEQHWAGPASDVLDGGEYRFSVISQDATCKVRLEGPADPVTGLQFSREIAVSGNSPQVSFHAVMRNVTGYPIRWSIQSVTQYDTSDARVPARYSQDFWTMAPINAHSAYVEGYHVRSGLADDPSFRVNDSLFTLHWLYLENEVWLDSDAGWIAAVDNAARYGMIERFQWARDLEYPGKTSVIFYKNGAALELDSNGAPKLRSANPDEAPYYMEAEINSPMVRLEPGVSYAFDTDWFPVRLGKDLKTVTAAGVIERPLSAAMSADGLQLSGLFDVFFPGKLRARVFDIHGAENDVEIESVDPLKTVELNRTIRVSSQATRVTIHLNDEQGIDLGSLGEAKITKLQKDL